MIEIRGNSISGAGLDGIHVVGIGDAVIADNDVRNSGRHGVYHSDGKLEAIEVAAREVATTERIHLIGALTLAKTLNSPTVDSIEGIVGPASPTFWAKFRAVALGADSAALSGWITVALAVLTALGHAG
jgi:hypothetical protein